MVDKIVVVACFALFVGWAIWLCRPRNKGWPRKCDLCGHMMESEDDCMFWHGIGDCVEMCDCYLISPKYPSDCVICGGKGWLDSASDSQAAPKESPESKWLG